VARRAAGRRVGRWALRKASPFRRTGGALTPNHGSCTMRTCSRYTSSGRGAEGGAVPHPQLLSMAARRPRARRVSQHRGTPRRRSRRLGQAAAQVVSAATKVLCGIDPRRPTPASTFVIFGPSGSGQVDPAADDQPARDADQRLGPGARRRVRPPAARPGVPALESRSSCGAWSGMVLPAVQPVSRISRRLEKRGRCRCAPRGGLKRGGRPRSARRWLLKRVGLLRHAAH